MKILYKVRQTVSQNKSYLWAKSSQFSHDRTHKLFVVENIKASFDIFFFLSFWFLYLSYNIHTMIKNHRRQAPHPHESPWFEQEALEFGHYSIYSRFCCVEPLVKFHETNR